MNGDHDAYGPRAAYYDLFAAHRADREPPSVRFFTGRTPPGARVLDVGAGTGRVSLAVADRAGEVCALEPSPAMRAILLAKLAGRPDLWPRVTVLDHAAPAFRLPRSFGYAYLAGVLQHLAPAQRPELFATLARHLDPGGLLAVDMICGDDDDGRPPAPVDERLRLGASSYTLRYSATPAGPDRQCVRLEYRVTHPGATASAEVVEHVRHLHRCTPVVAELRAAGFEVVGGSAVRREPGPADGGTILARYAPHS